jgi:hypothetical protein
MVPCHKLCRLAAPELRDDPTAFALLTSVESINPFTWSICTQHNSHYTSCNICTQIKSGKVIVKVWHLSPSMWLPSSAIIHCHRINRCPLQVKVISMLSYHLMAISRPQQANHLKSIWTNHTWVQQKVETNYQSRYSTRSGQLIGVSRIAAFVVFYKDFDVTHVHTGGSRLQNGVSLVNM